MSVLDRNGKIIKVGDTVEYISFRGEPVTGVVTRFEDQKFRGTRVYADWSNGIKGFMTNDTVTLIKKGDSEMAKYKVGDILVDEDGDYYKVLGVGNHGFELSDYCDEPDDGCLDNFDEYVKFDDMDGYTKHSELKEVTLEEIASKFGVDTSKLRIKE